MILSYDEMGKVFFSMQNLVPQKTLSHTIYLEIRNYSSSSSPSKSHKCFQGGAQAKLQLQRNHFQKNYGNLLEVTSCSPAAHHHNITQLHSHICKLTHNICNIAGHYRLEKHLQHNNPQTSSPVRFDHSKMYALQ